MFAELKLFGRKGTTRLHCVCLFLNTGMNNIIKKKIKIIGVTFKLNHY